MHISSTTPDNITEVLSKIHEFTRRRREVISENILNVNVSGFEPKDLDVDEFADLMTQAISEHMQSSRLLLCDGENIHFGANGSFETRVVVDDRAKRLLVNDTKEYLRSQVRKLSENLLNTRVAGSLLAKKQRVGTLPRYF